MPERPDDLAEGLLRLCRSNEPSPAWLTALRKDKSALSRATGGEPLTVEVAITDVCEIRLGITPSGHVVFPLSPGGEADARITGDAATVARFLLDDETPLTAHLANGILHLPWAETSVERVSRLRALVARHLRTLIEGTTPAALVYRRSALRLRCASLRSRAVGYVLETASPAMLAAATVVAASTATQPPVAAATAPPPSVVRLAPTTASPPLKPSMESRDRAAGTLHGSPVLHSGVVPGGAVAKRPEVVAPDAELQTPRPGGQATDRTLGGVVHCNTDVRQRVCELAEPVPLPRREP
jgi:hypothetical protein